MTSPPPSDSPAGAGVPPSDDTAAFQRFYLDEQAKAPEHGLLYRLLVGWWRKD